MYQILRERRAKSLTALRKTPADARRIRHQLGRSAGLKTPWINNLRGGLSDTLFARNVGRNKTRLPHPDGGSTILDYAFEPSQRPGAKTGRKEWVEQKSDLITAPLGSHEVFAPAVRRARRYVMDATLDLKALDASAVTKGDTILIEFVCPAGNEPTQRAMLDVLFADGKPGIQAVKFADGPGSSAQPTARAQPTRDIRSGFGHDRHLSHAVGQGVPHRSPITAGPFGLVTEDAGFEGPLDQPSWTAPTVSRWRYVRAALPDQSTTSHLAPGICAEDRRGAAAAARR